MRKITILFAAKVLVCLGDQPAAGTCPEGAVCVTIEVGLTAAEVAAEIESNWNLPEFACDAPAPGVTAEGGIEISTGSGSRIIVYEIPATTVQNEFEYEIRFSQQTGTGAQSPFDMFVNYDNTGEIMIRDGVTSFPEIDMIVSTPAEPAALTAIGSTGAVLFVAGLLAAGVAIILVRRF